MRRLIFFLGVLSALGSPVWAKNETLGDPIATLRARLSDALPASYMTSGCLPAGFTGTTFLNAFACNGVVRVGGAAIPVSQSAATVGALTGGNGIYWVGLHPDTTSAVAGWTRQLGTHYLWIKSDPRPATLSLVVFAKVTIAGAVITTVEDWRVPASYVRNSTYDVTDPLYGGVADDSTDIAPAIQLAINAAIAQKGYDVLIPQGLYAIKSGVTIPEGVHVHGVGAVVNKTQATGPGVNTEPRRGTYLHVSTTGFSPFTITGNGTRLSDLAFDHDQPVVADGWAPTVYPYAVQISTTATWIHGDVEIDHLFFFKASHGINQSSVGGQSGARINVHDIYGQVFVVGIRYEFVADLSRIWNIHFWPYWSADARILAYEALNTQAFVILRTDGLLMHDIFVLGAAVGIEFDPSSFGVSTGFMGVNISLDVVRTGLNATQTGGTMQLVNFRTAGNWDGTTFIVPFADAQGIRIAGTSNTATIVNFEGTSFGDNCITVSGNSVLTLSNFTCSNFNLAGANNAALRVLSGTVFVTGSQLIGNQHGAPLYAGTFGVNSFPGGAAFNQSGQFTLTESAGTPTITFAPGDVLQWLPSTNQFKIFTDAGTYNTGGVKRYLCIQDGVLTVGTTCP